MFCFYMIHYLPPIKFICPKIAYGTYPCFGSLVIFNFIVVIVFCFVWMEKFRSVISRNIIFYVFAILMKLFSLSLKDTGKFHVCFLSFSHQLLQFTLLHFTIVRFHISFVILQHGAFPIRYVSFLQFRILGCAIRR